jgi:hypothetical protein
MPNREEALRRIFEAAGVSARLSGDQKRELLAHLEDAVEAKVGAGMSEMDAVGQAFLELGDLGKIARDFPPAPGALAATPHGFIRLWWGGAAEMGYLLLLFFTFVEMMILPSFAVVFARTQVPLPGLTVLCLTIAGVLRLHWPLVAAALVILGAALFRIRRLGRWRAAVESVLVLAGALLCALVLAAATLPLLGLLEGTWRR